jgi:hypothetical protein
MAERRMFAKTIVFSDEFLDMPPTSRCLYFTLGMVADDDGFINNPKSVMRQCGASMDDLKILITKKFVLIFDDGVVVIKHWRIHNFIRKDTYSETKYKDDKALLELDENKAYSMNIEPRQRPVNVPSTQVRLGKVSIGKINTKDIPADESSLSVKKNIKHRYGQYKHVMLTDIEHKKLLKDYANAEECITWFDEYIEMKGYKANSHYLAIRKWVAGAVEKEHEKRNHGYNCSSRKSAKIELPEYMKQQRANGLPAESPATDKQIAELKAMQKQIKDKNNG